MPAETGPTPRAARARLDDFPEDPFYLWDFVFVGDLEDHIDAPLGLVRDTANDVTLDLPVGYDQGLVIQGEDSSRDQIHIPHLPSNGFRAVTVERLGHGPRRAEVSRHEACQRDLDTRSQDTDQDWTVTRARNPDRLALPSLSPSWRRLAPAPPRQ